MNQDTGERWHCMNAACRKEVAVADSEIAAGNRPRCSCGAEMKRAYTPPTLRYLDFLRLEEPLLTERAMRKD